jgi:hypothetical protein
MTTVEFRSTTSLPPARLPGRAASSGPVARACSRRRGLTPSTICWAQYQRLRSEAARRDRADARAGSRPIQRPVFTRRRA